MTEPPKAHEEALDEFVEKTERGSIPALRQLIVFGSVARGTHATNSDIDILAVLEADADIIDVEEQLRDIAYDVMLEYGTVFSIHGITETAFNNRSGHPFFKRVSMEGRAIYG